MTMDKVFLTGSGGVVGSAIYTHLVSLGFSVDTISSENLKQVDPQDLRKLLRNCGFVVHCAANTDVESCERTPQVAHEDIVSLTAKLADVARTVGAQIVYLSSTGVYGGDKKAAHVETELPAPPTVHHKCKLLAENYCVGADPKALIVRTGWIFGDGPRGNKAFVKAIIQSARNELSRGNTSMASNPFQSGSPTFNQDLAKAIGKMLLARASGIYNCVNTGNVSRFDYVKEIIRLAGIDIDVVALDEPPNRVAPVSENEAASNEKLENELSIFLPSWDESLKSYIESLGL
jgi:dTDP-4-dehydrorhamnose reductase